MIKLKEFRVDFCVHGYDIYKDIWYAVVSKALLCKRELNNSQDRYAVAEKGKILRV